MKKYLVLSFVLVSVLFAQALPEDIVTDNSHPLYFDLAITAILCPTETIYEGWITFQVAICNYGSMTAESIPVLAYVIPTTYQDTECVTLLAGNTTMVIFDPVYLNPGTYVFVCTLLVNDSTPWDNVARVTIVVLPSGIEETNSNVDTGLKNSKTIMKVPDFQSQLNNKNILIYDATGKMVNLRNLKSGIYFLRVSDNKRTSTHKVLLVRH